MKKFGLLTVASACAIAMAAMAPVQNAEAKGGLPACTSTISACGCVINSPGNYAVGQNLTGTDSSTDCIDIKAKNVNLNTESYAISGPGAVGINVFKSAKKANVQLRSTAVGGNTLISGFTTGLQIAAPNTTVFWGYINENLGDGVVFAKSANGSRLTLTDMDNNGGNGMTINGASNLVLDDFDSEDSAGVGLDITGGKNLRIGDFSTDDNGTGGVVMTKTKNSVLEDFDADDIAKGAGITLTKTKGDTLVGVWAVGDAADGVDIISSKGDTIQDFETYYETMSGVVVSGSKNINVVDGDADENGVYGVQLQNTSNSLVQDMYDATGDAIVGVYVGCETKVGPAGTACSDIGPSNSNVINAINAGYDYEDDVAEEYGVAVDYKDSKNLITGVFARGSSNYDAIDENDGCDSNTWFNIGADTATPDCIGAVPPTTATPITRSHNSAQHFAH